MDNYNFLKPFLWSKTQNQFLKPMILIFVILICSLLLLATPFTSEILVHIDDLSNTQLVATHYACSEQYILRKFSLFRVEKGTHFPSEIEYTGTFVSVFVRGKVKRSLSLLCNNSKYTSLLSSRCTWQTYWIWFFGLYGLKYFFVSIKSTES